METHNAAVRVVASKLREFYDKRQPYRMYHGSTNSTRKVDVKRDQMIDTSRMIHILSVDTERKIVLVEPNVPMDSLVQVTLQHGLVPPVVMEFPGITVGGGLSGHSFESSSFRYGLFDRCVSWIEMVLANGEIVEASKTLRPDLFAGAASSFGTLGVTTLIELQLIEAKSYVELTYHVIKGDSINEAMRIVRDVTTDSEVDYVDGILFSKSEGVVCSGRLTDVLSPGVKIQCFSRAIDPWFYHHAQKIFNNNSSSVIEVIPLTDYLFRYDRGSFWMGKYAFSYFYTPFNRVTRWILDYYMHTRVMYHALHKSEQYNMYIIQDVAVPYSTAEEFVEYLDQDFGHYPIWLCPMKQTDKSGETPSGPMTKNLTGADEMLMNFGVWGPGPREKKEFLATNRRLERKVAALDGKKWLYAQAYYTEEEFWSHYDKKEYDALRAKYHASHLLTVYDKVNVNFAAEGELTNNTWIRSLQTALWNTWPISGLYGVYAATVGGEYLLPRKVA